MPPAKKAMAAAAQNQPNPGPDDCYNRVTETCNAKHPGKDWGDKEYRDCITAGLDWCDVNEPTRSPVLPVFDSRGRLAKAGRVDKLMQVLRP
jgi:hypothetical protein